MSGALLAFGAHPDDLELSCGGWLAAAANAGHHVVMVDLTRGERATNGTPAERAAEAEAAARVLGVAERHNLGLPDGGLDPHEEAQVAALVQILRVHQPALVLGPTERARHPDHAAAGALVARAWFLAGVGKVRPDLGPPSRAPRRLQYPQRQEVRPDLVVDISTTHGVKWRAIRCHASQFGEAGVETLINQPLGLQAFEVRDRYWGATIGVTHGEPYVLGGPVPMSDPMAHFADHPAVPVLGPPGSDA